MAKAWERVFPNLTADDWLETSKDTITYNCIAWAVGDTTKRWWPDPFGELYWPSDIQRIAKVENFITLFERQGYSICADDSVEPGFEKVVIYAKGTARAVKHAAWQLEDGTWTSKLGREEDINHKTPEGLTSQEYGEPVQFLKRLRKSTKMPMT